MPLAYCRKCDSLDEVDSARLCPRCGSTLNVAELATSSSEFAAQDGDGEASADGIPNDAADGIPIEATDGIPIEAADGPPGELISGIDDSPCERGLLHLLASPVGRIGRVAFLGSNGLFIFLAADVWLAMILTSSNPELSVPAIAALGVIALSSILVSVKRLHDFDQPGFALLVMSFCIGGFALLPLLFFPGTQGRNQYGSPTRFRWGLRAFATVFVIVWSGTYALIVVAISEMAAEQIVGGRAAIEAGDLEAAGQKYRWAHEQAVFGLRICPSDHFRIQRMAAEEMQGFVLLERKSWDEAVRWYRAARQTADSLIASGRASEIAGDIEIIQKGLAAALTAAGRHDEALAVRKESAGKMDPGNLSLPEVRSMRWTEGMVLFKQGKNEEARDVFAKLIEVGEQRLKKDPADQQVRSDLAGALNNRGLARRELGDLNGARADFQEAIRLQTIARDAVPQESSHAKSLGQFYANCGLVFWDEQDIDQALEAFSSGLKADPDSIDLRKLLSTLRFGRKEYAEVIELLDRILESEKDVSLEYCLAVCYLKRDDVDRAARVVDRLCTRHPDSVEGRFLTGVVKLKKQDYSASVEALNEAFAIKPNEPAILYDLALSLFGLNRKSDADQAILKLRDCDAGLAAVLERHFSAPDSAGASAPVIIEMLAP